MKIQYTAPQKTVSLGLRVPANTLDDLKECVRLKKQYPGLDVDPKKAGADHIIKYYSDLRKAMQAAAAEVEKNKERSEQNSPVT